MRAGVKPTAGTGATASKLGTIRRPDGRMQVTYNRLALDRYSLETKPGHDRGEGVGGSWFAVTPAGKLARARSTTTTETTTAAETTTTTDTTTMIGY